MAVSLYYLWLDPKVTKNQGLLKMAKKIRLATAGIQLAECLYFNSFRFTNN